MNNESPLKQYAVIFGTELLVAVLVVGGYVLYTQKETPIFGSKQEVSGAENLAAARAIEKEHPVLTADIFSEQIKKQTSAPLAVLEQISGNEIVVKVPVINPGSLAGIDLKNPSKNGIELNTTVKTFTIVLNSHTEFSNFLQKDLVVGGSYNIVVDKPFWGAAGKLTAIRIASSSIPAEMLSTPLSISPQ